MPFPRRLAALAIVLLLASAASRPAWAQEAADSVSPPSRWSFGPFIATFSGPSHEDVLNHVNGMMLVNDSDPGFQFANFDVGTPVGARLFYAINPVISLSSSYGFSQYFTKATFNPHQWESVRSLTTNLHELGLAVHYELSFVRSSKVEPYFGLGINFALADSKLAIDLVNTPGVTEDEEEGSPLLPGFSTRIPSRDSGIGALALAGLSYHFTSRVGLNAEIQGVMGQIRQHFDYAGSLQHIQPATSQEIINDPKVNDILLGSYPLDLNGLRLSVCLLFRI